jgi:hypothetical protein
MRRVLLVVTLAMAPFTALLGASPAGAGKASDVVTANPAPGSSLESTGGFYLLTLRSGASAQQSVHISNPNGHSDSVRVDAVDGFTNQSTGSAFGQVGSPVGSTGRWVVVSTPLITLAAQATRDVAFTVHVPPRTPPGQYLAGISVAVPLATPPTPGHTGPKKASFNMDLQYQRVIAVEVDVPGPRAPRLVVTGADATATASGIVLGLHIANQGNAFAHGSGVVRVADTNTDTSFKIDTFVSGTSIVYPMPWTKTAVQGTHHVEVDLNYEGHRHASWTGVVTVDSSLASALANVAPPPHKPSSFPWLLVLAALLLLAFIIGAIVMRRRARRPSPFNYRPI